ncbi:hypothetical protein Scep_005489 [Stephania cephalantha]|uniref:Uncharacterized protein n=1 Tax=Stephania cephalantha TaxID=152367 RepID=A0AAP0KVB2_9MAGN
MSMKYHLCRVCVVWVLVLIVVAQAHNSRGAAEARAGPVLMMKHQRQFDLWRTLGVGCNCCDGESGQCRSTWEGSCTKLECLPWKLF